MADTTTRTLRLLSLLQRRRYWAGPDLAERLRVSDRTLRRDIDRLRELGYTIESERGVDGGYRLGGTEGETALLLDDEEATALATALSIAASGPSELAEASLGALSKVLSMLGPHQRRRAETVRTATAFATPFDSPGPRLSVLDTVASACRDQVRISFDYVAADGAATSRYVEPCQLVAINARWYLVAHDSDRRDWRTFRIDRITDPVPGRNSFTPRTPPADDLADYVRSNLRRRGSGQRIVVDVDIAGDRVRDGYGTWVDVEDLTGERSRITMEADSFIWPTHIVTSLDVSFTVVSPAEFEHHLASVATRLRSCVDGGLT